MWEKIQIQINCVETQTNKAVLINFPKNSKYKGYSFWHPMKCCRQVGKNGYLLQISFTEDFEFKIKKYGKGQYNYKDVLDEKTISPNELKEAFGFGVNEDLLGELEDDV